LVQQQPQHQQRCLRECAILPGHVAVRDSKDPDGPVLVFTPAQWSAFVATVARPTD
jgi:hypothetical protein